MEIQVPFRMIVAGPSQSGKTRFTTEFIRHLPKWSGIRDFNIVWCVGEKNAIPPDLPKRTKIHIGLPDITKIKVQSVHPHLIILDDLMCESGKDVDVLNVFTKNSHHNNISVILLVQNIFYKGRHMRDISLNATYIVCMKNPRDESQFMHLARQLYPDNPSALHRVYKEATQTQYSHFLVDCSQVTPAHLRFKSDIFSTFPSVYVSTD